MPFVEAEGRASRKPGCCAEVIANGRIMYFSVCSMVLRGERIGGISRLLPRSSFLFACRAPFVAPVGRVLWVCVRLAGRRRFLCSDLFWVWFFCGGCLRGPRMKASVYGTPRR